MWTNQVEYTTAFLEKRHAELIKAIIFETGAFVSAEFQKIEFDDETLRFGCIDGLVARRIRCFLGKEREFPR